MLFWLGFGAIGSLVWLALRPRFGAAGASAVTILGGLLALGVTMTVAQVGNVPLGWSVLCVGLGVAAWAAWRIAAAGSSAMRPTYAPEMLAVGLGAIAATASFILAGIVPSGSRLSWAMLGDSASQLVDARRILDDGGLVPPPMPNPVPLTPGLVAAAAVPGRSQVGAGGAGALTGDEAAKLLEHDLHAYVATWAALIVLLCLLTGLAARTIADRIEMRTGPLRLASIAAASIVPLGWFWTGYPIKFGFVNAHLALVILLAAVIGHLGLAGRRGWQLGLSCTGVVLAALTWTPLALIPLALGVPAAVSLLMRLWRLGSVARIAACIAAAVLLAVATRASGPALAEARASLSTPGGLAEFPRPMLAGVALAVIALAFASGSIANFDLAWSLIGTAVAAALGLAAVVWLSGGTQHWSYYPHKFAWIASALLLLIAPVPLAVAIGRIRWRLPRVATGAVALVGLAVSLGLGSTLAPGRAGLLADNLPSLLLHEDYLPNGGKDPDALAAEVVSRTASERLTIPWRSDIPNDYRVTFWLLQLEVERARQRADWTAADELWTLANFHDDPEDLCAVAAATPRGLTVQTSDASLGTQLATICPGAEVVVEFTTYGETAEPER